MKKLNMMQKRGLVGWTFIMPWFLGLMMFFFQPMVSFARYSFSKFTFAEHGGFILKPLEKGMFENYASALFTDPKYPVLITETLTNMLYQVPIIVFFSLFVAVLLSKDFRGKAVMRAIFFLPIIVASGSVREVTKLALSSLAMSSSSESTNLFSAAALMRMMMEGGIPPAITNFLIGLIQNVGELIWRSGIQILIFMSALLSISPSYYEAAQIEGATGWEVFWKITFPIVSPFILASTIYTIIDSLTEKNPIIDYIVQFSVKDMNYSYAAAMSWIYFTIITLIIGIVLLISRRYVFYSNK